MFPEPPLPDDCYENARELSMPHSTIEHCMNLLAGEAARRHGRLNTVARAE